MNQEIELWQFAAARLKNNGQVMLLIVAKSSGSSPGRAGYKMAVGADGDLCGSIGGGVMEVDVVENARSLLSEPGAIATGFIRARLIEQVHQKNSPHSSGMICSGRQTVISRLLTKTDLPKIEYAIDLLESGNTLPLLIVTPDVFAIGLPECPSIDGQKSHFEKRSAADFTYSEFLGPQGHLYIIGGGHCALALSELMSKLDFHITIFDDRAELNTMDKNQFADEVRILKSYEEIGQIIDSDPDAFVVVMTLGYVFDEIVIRSLIDKEFKYFGVLGSKAKMAVLLKDLQRKGIPAEKLQRLHTPIGLRINSHTPEEIAVSIAAEIISVKNAA